MDNLSYLFAAFAIVWAMVFIYVLVLSRRLQRLKQDIELLEENESEHAQS